MVRHYSDDSVITFAMEMGMTPYVNLLKTILKNEYMKNKECPFVEEKAIALDEYEKVNAKKEKRQQRPTVDCVIGLEHNQLLMVEMKFNATSRNKKNLANDVMLKHESSCGILRCSSNYVCLNKMVVLLSDKNFDTQKNKLHRSLANNPNYEILRTSEFYNRYFKGDEQKVTA